MSFYGDKISGSHKLKLHDKCTLLRLYSA